MLLDILMPAENLIPHKYLPHYEQTGRIRNIALAAALITAAALGLEQAVDVVSWRAEVAAGGIIGSSSIGAAIGAEVARYSQRKYWNP
jgi:hypothetical protein